MSRRRPDTGGIAAGIVFTIIGVVFLLQELDVLTARLNYVLPLVLIGIGASMLVSWLAHVSDERRH
jgi:hypothetical protein